MATANQPINTVDVAAIRRDFPIFNRVINGKPLVYLDSAASSQRPEPVVEGMARFFRESNANIHRGIYQLSMEATDQYEAAREKVRAFLNAPSEREIIFVRNATEAINLVAYAWGRKFVGRGDVIVATELEHHSNIVPWQRLAAEKGAELKFIGITDEGRLREDDLDRIAHWRPKLVTFTHVSNGIGTVNPARAIVKRAHEAGALALVDAAQSAPHRIVDVQDLDCDFLALSGHKMLGPTGIGVLYGREAILEEMDPFLTGGDMIREVHLHSASWNELPYKFEAGTPAIAEGIGLGLAIDYLNQIGLEPIRQHEAALVQYGLERFAEIDGLHIYGPPAADRGGVISFNVTDIHPHDLATILDEEGIAIRAGHHCCQPLMERLDVMATSRASFYIYNTESDVDRLIDGIYRAKAIFKV